MEQESIKKKVIGIDISLEATTYAIVDVRGEMIVMDKFPTLDYPDINQFISALSDHLIEMVEKHGGYESIRSVGISAPSANFMTGSIENAPNLPWKGVVPLAAMLRDQLGIAVALANNAHVMALGEQAYGAAHGMRNFVLVSLGSGMGSCLFSNGIIHLGSDGFAGEIGHACIKPGGRLCGCGKQGCLETYTAARGIVLTAQEVMAESQEPSKMRQVEQLTPQIIADLCNEGDALAIETYRRTGYILGIGLANYASVVNPEAFIFAGQVSKAGRWLLEPASDSFEQHVFHNMVGKVKMVLSTIEDDVRNVLGASVLAWEVKEYSLFK